MTAATGWDALCARLAAFCSSPSRTAARIPAIHSDCGVKIRIIWMNLTTPQRAEKRAIPRIGQIQNPPLRKISSLSFSSVARASALPPVTSISSSAEPPATSVLIAPREPGSTLGLLNPLSLTTAPARVSSSAINQATGPAKAKLPCLSSPSGATASPCTTYPPMSCSSRSMPVSSTARRD